MSHQLRRVDKVPSAGFPRQRNCVVCSTPFEALSGRAKYCTGCSPRRRPGGGGHHAKHLIRCAQCRQQRLIRKRTGRFCSNACYGAWRSRPFYGPPRPAPMALVHVGSTRRLLAAERLGVELSSGRVWLAGQCRRCAAHFVGDQFTWISLYCSRSCARSDSKDRRRVKMKAGTGRERVYRRRIFERDGWRCQLCRRKVDRTKKVPHPMAPTLDHIIPLAAGGRHEPANVQLAHFSCNSLKNAGVYGQGEQLRLVG